METRKSGMGTEVFFPSLAEITGIAAAVQPGDSCAIPLCPSRDTWTDCMHDTYDLMSRDYGDFYW
jgi:hypothetical protein